MRMKPTILGASLLALLAAAGFLWSRGKASPPVTAPPPVQALPPRARPPATAPAQDPQTASRETEALRLEIATLKTQLSTSKETGAVQQSVYQALLEQAQKNLSTHPLEMSWDDFYRASQTMQVDENTLLQNILLRLHKELGLSEDQYRELLGTLYEERARTEAGFRERYGQKIEAGMLNLADEESKQIAEDILKIRTEVRKGFETRYAAFLSGEQLKPVNQHLRNDLTVSFTSDGDVQGGIGIFEQPKPAPAP